MIGPTHSLRPASGGGGGLCFRAGGALGVPTYQRTALSSYAAQAEHHL